MKQTLLFHMPWYKVEESAWEKQMEELSRWGVKQIVAPQYFHRPGGFVRTMDAMAHRHGICISAAHGLLGLEYDLGFAAPKALEEHRRYLDDLAAIGATTYTLHAGTHHPVDQTGIWERLENSLETLLPIAEKNKITLAMENIYEPLPALTRMVEIVASFHHPNLGLCLDVGHANISPAGLDAVYALMAPRLVTCHLHDNDGKTDSHGAPGTGNIHWEKLASRLTALPGIIHFETETRSYSPEIWREYKRIFKQEEQ